MALSTRQPFGELGAPRLQTLQSAKNRQNAVAAPANTFSSPLKSHPTPSTGKRRASSVFDDCYDAENVDPAFFNSPTKKSKHSSSSSRNDAGWIKPAKFNIVSTPSATTDSRTPLTASPSVPSVRKALSSTSTSSTPISHSRGSPKHKRVNLLAKRRTSTSPFRRVDPPSFSTQSTPGSGLPFSIDAALSGTIPNYTPKSSVAAPVVQQQRDAIEDSMPKGWFFEIHEDTPEQEAANLMEHSASILDISSEDDFETKQLNEDRGKENVPPPDWTLAQQPSSPSAGDVEAVEHVKLPRLRKIAQDAMDEDRKPLGDLPAAEFYGEGCDAKTYVTVGAGMERPSGLSRELEAPTSTPVEQKRTEEKEKSVVAEVAVEVLKKDAAKEEDLIPIFVDEEESSTSVAVVAPTEEEIPALTSSTTPETQTETQTETETETPAECSEAL